MPRNIRNYVQNFRLLNLVLLQSIICFIPDTHGYQYNITVSIVMLSISVLKPLVGYFKERDIQQAAA